MKAEFKISGCPYEEAEAIKIFVSAFDLHSTIQDVREHIRSSLKHENLSEETEEALLEIRKMLNIPWIDD
jgi:hypothetical protein